MIDTRPAELASIHQRIAATNSVTEVLVLLCVRARVRPQVSVIEADLARLNQGWTYLKP